MLSAPHLYSQNSNPDYKNGGLYYQWYIDINTGFTNSYCDIQSGHWQGDQLFQSIYQNNHNGFAYGLRFGKHITKVFGIYAAVIRGNLKGRSGVDTKGLMFETDLHYDAIIAGSASISNIFFGYEERLMNFYGTLGYGYAFFSSETFELSPWRSPVVNIKKYPYGTKYDKATEALVITGLGIDFRINNRWDFIFETTIRWFLSDKLDGIISGKENDAYYYTTLGFTYNFWHPEPKYERCNKFK